MTVVNQACCPHWDGQFGVALWLTVENRPGFRPAFKQLGLGLGLVTSTGVGLGLGTFAIQTRRLSAWREIAKQTRVRVRVRVRIRIRIREENINTTMKMTRWFEIAQGGAAPFSTKKRTVPAWP